MDTSGLGESRDRRFADFAEQACRSQQTITIKLREAYALVLAIEKALTKTKSIDAQHAFRMASNGIILACQKCGEYSDQARDAALLGGEGGAFEHAKGVVFGGPTVAALAQGRCPGCNGQEVRASFGP